MTMPREWPAKDLESVPACPICSSASRVLLYGDLTDRVFAVAPGSWMLYRCMQCESGYLDPRPTVNSIDLAYKSYYTHAAEDTPEGLSKNPLVRQLHAWVNDHINSRYGLALKPTGFGGRWLVPLLPSFKAKANSKLRHLPRPPSDGGRLLDVGFGNGGFLKIASEMGWNAEGIDFDPKAVEVARARGLNVSCASAAGLSLRNEQYDVITLSHVIEHVHEPIALLHDLNRLLKPGGLLWIETPNIKSLGARRFNVHWRGLEVPRHLVLFNPASLHMSLTKTRFSQIEQHWHGMALFSIYGESAAMARGQSPQGTIRHVVPSIAAIVDELREMWQPSRREFLTFTAHK